MERLYDGDTFTRGAYTFRVKYERDNDMQEPWKEHDGHGIVSEWTTRDKAPGERVLVTDRNHRRYYDVAATLKLARKDGWGCPCAVSHDASIQNTLSGGHPLTRKAEIAHAVDADFEHMRAWCNDEWEWTWCLVTLLDDQGGPTDVIESLGGIEPDDSGAYLTQVAHELADQIIARIEVETPDVVLSEN